MPAMLRKMMGTLTLNISKSIHTSISLIFLYKSCSVATPEHPEPLPLQNRVCIVAVTPVLRRVSFHSATEFLHHSSTIELLVSLVHIKGSYLSSHSLPTMLEIVISVVVALVRKFIHDRHRDQYLESKQLVIVG